MTDLSNTAQSTDLVPFSGGKFVDPAGTRLIVGILTCEKYRERADGIRNSWLKLAPANYRILFVFGRPGQEPSLHGDRLYLDCPEAYENLPEKVHSFLAYCLENFAFDYIFKTDDDTYLDLERFISLNKDGGDYIGRFRDVVGTDAGRTWHYGKCDDKAYEVPYKRPFVCAWATGGGYLLSHRAVARAVERSGNTFAQHLYEDIMIGEALTPDPDIKKVRLLFETMGVINPLLAKDMLYLQGVLLEKRQLAEEVLALRQENRELKSGCGSPVPGT